MTYLCAAIFVIDPAQAQRDVAVAAERGADMVELRIDELDDPKMVREVVSRTTLPCIVTCRSAQEGGRSHLADVERYALLRAAREAGAAYVDIEWATFQKTGAPRFESPLILSSHDFSGRPERLYNLLNQLQSSPADIQKVVWMARSVRDNLEIFEILQQRAKPTIALCMGESGLISRVLAKKFGAFLTFASLETGGGTADGQISLSEMKSLYRWDAITQATKIYGVVASPVGHSMSPAIHNAAFDVVDHDGVYLPFHVEAGYERFKAFMETFVPFEGLDLSGLSITLPHKENALRYLKEKGSRIEPLAERIGAVNTIAVDRSSDATVLRGFNSDYAAILDSITSALGISREELRGRSVAVIGAGGTGRTAVAALAQYGAKVVIYNRTRGRADDLAKEFTVHAADWDALAAGEAEIYFNATSIGMSPKVNQSPFGDIPPPFDRNCLVFDAVYNPTETLLLRQAAAAGAQTISGMEMFVRQAATQFEAWTEQPAPMDIMRKVIERRLA
jgi:3-dehydroquinate dehydratase/shikimate dehydrogenase